MSDKCYRVEFTAHLHKLTLALKMQCQIQVIWKRGQKVCESGKIPLVNGEANFDKKISISCNMIFNPKTKIFKQKITKFSIILMSEKGTKQAGQIQFDVAGFINQRQLQKKQYQQRLGGCPDKNAKLSFTLTGVLKEQLGMDAISQSSYVNTDNGVLDQSSSNNKTKSNQSVPTQDKSKPETKNENIKKIEDQNRKIRQQLKLTQKLKKQNQELSKKIKAQDYKKSAEVKQKMEKYKKQIQKMKSQIRANKKIEDETAQLQKQILHCKIKMMKAFNYAAEYGGSSLVDKIQDYCGILQK